MAVDIRRRLAPLVGTQHVSLRRRGGGWGHLNSGQALWAYRGSPERRIKRTTKEEWPSKLPAAWAQTGPAGAAQSPRATGTGAAPRRLVATPGARFWGCEDTFWGAVT